MGSQDVLPLNLIALRFWGARAQSVQQGGGRITEKHLMALCHGRMGSVAVSALARPSEGA